jgi:hypothetical protein
MRRSIALLVLLAAGSSYASDKTYQAGRLNGIAIQDVTKTYAAPERGRDYFQTWHFGVDYQFQIVADDIVYIADCWSRATRNHASDLLLKDPIEFRIEKINSSSRGRKKASFVLHS